MKSRVLIVDDEMFIREILKMKLEEEGIDVETATDPFEAEMNLEEGKKYDLIISDIMMQVKSGLEFVRSIREEHKLKEQNIMILSARKLTNDMEILKEYGVEHFLTKPFKMEEFVEKVKKILKNSCKTQ